VVDVVIAAAGDARSFVAIDVPPWAWVALVSVIVLLLIGDLLIVHRRPHAISTREAAIETAVWIAIGLSFAGLLAWWVSGAAAGEYLAGYLIEKSLSVDNVFVWAILFSYFRVPAEYQFRVLFWGIFGALVMRAMFIGVGVAAIERFDWILYIFGAFLVLSAIKIARHRETEVHPERNLVLRAVRAVVPSTPDLDGQRLFTRRSGRWLATPLFAVLIMVETTDVVFAVDSVPAILAVSREAFIVFAANAFAIMGLRSLYFLLAGMKDRFRYLHIGLGFILGFVGLKMLASAFVHPPTWVSLGVIVVALAVSVVASMRAERGSEAQRARPQGDPTRDGTAGPTPPTPAAGPGRANPA